jgi:hypothetical protein
MNRSRIEEHAEYLNPRILKPEPETSRIKEDWNFLS